MISRNYVPATAEEKQRINRMMRLGCIVSRNRIRDGLPVPKGKVECHHMVMFGKRAGHLHSIPLSAWYHRGVVPYPFKSKAEARAVFGASIADGRKSFTADHGSELELWQQVQHLLGLSPDLPTSKRVPRRVA